MSTTSSDRAFDDLHHLITKGDRAKVRAWVESGADVNLRNQYGWSVLMLAALHGRTDIAEDLLAAGADATLENDRSDTAASLARVKGFKRTAQIIERRTRAG